MLIVITKRMMALILLLLVAAVSLLWIARDKPDAAVAPVQGLKKDYVILIQIDEKKLYLLEDDEVVKKYTISSGKSGYSSPIGNWKINGKAANWGGGFGARWLGLNVPWGKYGIHGTNDEGRIGYAVSHGCIRMRNKDVKELYGLVKVGTPVIIRNGPYGSFGMGFKTLEPGDRGADVYAVQQRLKELGYYAGTVSGIYNESLKHALHQFQREYGLPINNRINEDDYEAMGFAAFE